MLSQSVNQRKFSLFCGALLIALSLYLASVAWDWYRQYGYDGFLVGGVMTMSALCLAVGSISIVGAWRTPVERIRTFAELEAADFVNHDPKLVTQWLQAARQAKTATSGFPRWLIITAALETALGGLLFKAMGLVIWLVYLRFHHVNVRPSQVEAKRLQQAAGIDRAALMQALNRPQRAANW